MRSVLDTNVLVSGLISPHGPPAEIITRWLAGEFTLLYTQATIGELEDVLNRTWLKARLAKSPDQVRDLLEAVSVLGTLVTGYVNVTGSVADPFDEMFLACAVLGEADYVVSGDKELLAIVKFGGAEIVRPARFLDILYELEG